MDENLVSLLEMYLGLDSVSLMALLMVVKMADCLVSTWVPC